MRSVGGLDANETERDLDPVRLVKLCSSKSGVDSMLMRKCLA